MEWIALVAIAAILGLIYLKERTLMAQLSDLAVDVASIKGVVFSVVTLLDGLKDRLDAALASNDPQAIQDIIDSIDADKQELADAVTRDTPADAPPADVPPPA